MSQIHAKTDRLSLVAVPQPDGKMRVASNSWDDPLVILPGGVWRWRPLIARGKAPSEWISPIDAGSPMAVLLWHQVDQHPFSGLDRSCLFHVVPAAVVGDFQHLVH